MFVRSPVAASSLPHFVAALNRVAVVAALVAVPGVCAAHAGSAQALGFLTGLGHPLSGPDHLLAMLAVGLWGAQLRNDAIWMLPVAFPMVMALGAVAGILALPMLPVEAGVAVSVLALGSFIAASFRPPLAAAVLLVGVFAIFHGYAHGAELPRRADALQYCAGFVVATGGIHLCGIALGQVTRLRHGTAALRAAGAVIAASGVAFVIAPWLR